MKNILYISDISSNEPLFHSQVIPHIDELKKLYNVKLFCLSRGEQYNCDFSYNSIRGDYNVLLAYVNFLKNKRNVYSFLNNNAIDIIYARGFRGGILGSLLKKYFYRGKIRVITDIRGDALDEHDNFDSGLLSYFKKKSGDSSTRYIFKNSDTLFFVSSYLRDKYCKRYQYIKDTAIFPTFVPDKKFEFSEEKRLQYRKILGYDEDDIVMVYSGNMALWQNVDAILDAFGYCENKKLKLLILTKDSDIFSKTNSHINKDNIIIKKANYSEIQNYYFAADYGLLIRDDIDTNRCSAPTKFSEYLNAGLIPIVTDISADYIDYLKQSSLNYVMVKDKLHLNKEMCKLSAIKRNQIKLNVLSQIVDKQSEFI